MVALAVQFQHMLDRGEVRNHADLARLGCISRERTSQIMMLAWLAPHIQQEVLSFPKTPGGRLPMSETALRSVARLTVWDEQQAQWRELDQTRVVPNQPRKRPRVC